MSLKKKYSVLPLLSGVAVDDAFCTRAPDFHLAIKGFLLASSVPVETPTELIDGGPSQLMRILFESFEMVDDKIVTLSAGIIGAFRCFDTTNDRPLLDGDCSWPELFSEHQSSERPAISSASDKRFGCVEIVVHGGGCSAVWLTFRL